MKRIDLPRATIGRIPIYVRYLKDRQKNEPQTENISATALARALGLGEVQVRKDLSALCGAGRPKTGYRIDTLLRSLSAFLSPDKNAGVVLVGAGKLGRALLDYGGFAEYGLDILAGFDTAVFEPTKSHSGKMIYPAEQLCAYCRAHDVGIGIITVPAEAAQQAADALVLGDVRAIWCFAPVTLSLPPRIAVQYENMALSLAYLNEKII